MEYKDEDIIYILTKTDVDNIARVMGLKNLTAEHYRQVRKFFGYLCTDGPYTWRNAIEDGLKLAEGLQKTSFWKNRSKT